MVYLLSPCPYQSSFVLTFLLLQLIGVTDKAEKDEIVKSVMDLKKADINEGYTMEVVVFRLVGI